MDCILYLFLNITEIETQTYLWFQSKRWLLLWSSENKSNRTFSEKIVVILVAKAIFWITLVLLFFRQDMILYLYIIFISYIFRYVQLIKLTLKCCWTDPQLGVFSHILSLHKNLKQSCFILVTGISRRYRNKFLFATQVVPVWQSNWMDCP